MKHLTVLRGLLLSLVCSLPAWASEASVPAAPEIINAASLLRLVLGLGFVLLLIFGLAWITKRYAGLSQSQSDLKVIATLPLGAREKAVLISVGGEQMLVGVAPGRVNLIERFEQPVVAENQAKAATPAFATVLVDALNRRGKDS
ncbi:MAG: flagellar biosynthetic protein FliO [Pontibacterium sp.]